MANKHPSLGAIFDPASVHVIGTGPSLVVLHGGPGFSHAYLRPHLDFLASKYRLIYFDQLGAGGSVCPIEDVTFAAVRDHTLAVMRNFAVEDRVTIVAHSWGGLVALACLDADRSLEISGLLFNPLPVTRQAFEAMRAALFSKMPADLLAEILGEHARFLTQSQIDRLFPYYISPSSKVSPGNLSFDVAVYRTVCDTLGNFDFTPSLSSLSKCHVLVGEDDFISRQLTEDVTAAVASVNGIKDCGHFPFLERPVEFRAWALQSLLALSLQ